VIRPTVIDFVESNSQVKRVDRRLISSVKDASPRFPPVKHFNCVVNILLLTVTFVACCHRIVARLSERPQNWFACRCETLLREIVRTYTARNIPTEDPC
jgi:hypothetical protein